MEILARGEKEYILQLESEYIQKCDAQSPNGYNLSLGGDSPTWCEHSRRLVSGVNNHLSSLCKRDVEVIVDRDDLTISEVASLVGTTEGVVADIRKGYTYNEETKGILKDYSDVVRRARVEGGQNTSIAKLTEDNVKEIIDSYNVSVQSFAYKFKVDVCTVSRARFGQTWGYLPRPDKSVYTKTQTKKKGAVNITRNTYLEIKNSVYETVSNIVDKVGVTTYTVKQVRNGKINDNTLFVGEW